MRGIKYSFLFLGAVVLASLFGGCAPAPYYNEVVILVPVPCPYPPPPIIIEPRCPPSKTPQYHTQETVATKTKVRDRLSPPTRGKPRAEAVRGERKKGRTVTPSRNDKRGNTKGTPRTR